MLFFNNRNGSFLLTKYGWITSLNKRIKALSIYKSLNEPDKLLSTILTGNNIVNSLVSTIGTTVAIYYLQEWGILLAPLIVTFILLLFAETFPKLLANTIS
ncbi:MAG: DUF21 domain-containing protein [Planctomycetia bacterium]|nr:DUF21 domain-containing protein [Planctomycetia bacterium]